MIATYHKHDVLGTDDFNELLTAANWWRANSSKLRAAGEFTVNLMNEWGSHGQTPDTYSEAYNKAVEVIRTVYNGYIVIDIPGWGQEVNTAVLASGKIADKHIVLSAHIYSNGWNQGAGRNINADDMNALANTGRPCIIGEFGFDGQGPVNVESVVRRAKASGFLAVLGWSWNGDGGNMNMVTPSWSQSAKSSSYSESAYFSSIYSLL